MAEAGANVALVSRKIEHLEPAAKAINDERASNPGMGEAFAIAADVRNFEEIEEAILATAVRFGKIDILVNGAAGNFLSPAEALSPNGFGTVVDIDLKGTFNVCRAAFAQLKEHQGQILNISATLHYLGTPMQLHVSAAKAGVDALTRNLAVEWGRYGIRVNGIAPGPIEDTEAPRSRTHQRETAEEYSARPFRPDQRHREGRAVYLFRRGEFYQRSDPGC
jgi:peroxisomal 2,4-dienoyl-CoA reductase